MTTDRTVVAAGDAIVGTAIAIHDDDSDQRFRAMCDLIRGADVASINLETSLFELDTFSGWPSAERGGSYLLGSPDLVGDLTQIGFDLFARANNLSSDAPAGSRGTPRLAPVDLAESILKRLAAISSPYGFEFSVDKGVAQWLTDN